VYTIAAFIAAPEAAAVLADALGAPRVALEQGLELVPLRRPLPGRSGRPVVPSSFGEAMGSLTADAEDAAGRAAAHGPVVYAEAEYFGGVGDQHAVVWQGERAEVFESEMPGAINTALQALGVRRTSSPWTGEEQDEFDSVGLGRHRTTEEWTA
jgi:hypothetical protein